jgi:uncharacterized membrane protein (DUF485 family)
MKGSFGLYILYIFMCAFFVAWLAVSLAEVIDWIMNHSVFSHYSLVMNYSECRMLKDRYL